MALNRLLIRKGSRAARKGETYIAGYEFPRHIETRVRRRFTELDDSGWQLVERGLREWFVCCAWRGKAVLGMPSRLVDEAWHEFMLDSLAYTAFCDAAFGAYLHHTPDEAMSTPMGDALWETVRAWDRSDVGAEEESVLWDLDERIGIGNPLGIGGVQLSAIRSHSSAAAGGAYPYAGGGACGTGSGGSAEAACSSGDGGGGCGGGGCGGGS